jgi:membrane protease subunit HflK
VAEADGEASRFSAVLGEYKNAEGVTRQRMFLETIERVLGNSSTVVIDQKGGTGVVPYLPLDQINKKTEGAK